MPSFASVVQYVPDAVLGERINIGVVVYDSDGRTWTHFLKDWRRVRRFATGDVVDELKRFGQEAKGLTADDIRAAAARRWNSIRFTPPAGSLLDGDTLRTQSAQRFLIDPPRRPARGHMVKSRVVARARRRLRDALIDWLGGSGPLRLKADYDIVGQTDLPHRFDLAIVNGRPRYAAEAVSFQGPSERDIGKAVDATAYAVEDVRRWATAQALPLAVLVARPADGDPDRYAKAERTFADAGAEVVLDDELDEWADRVAGLIAAG
jgi:hypothetical protein